MATLKELGIIELEMRVGLNTHHPKVRVTQYDSGLTLEYDIVDRNGEVVTSLPDVIPMLYVEAPDKSAIGSAEGEIVDGKAIIPIPSSLLSKFGEAEAQVQLVNATTKEQIHDNTFILDIAQSKMDGEVSPGESIWFNLQDLKEAIASVQQLEEQYNADVQAVATMREDVTTKHGEVTTMHSSLQSVFDTEASRVLAEKARADAETNRKTAETTRVNAESARVTAEGTRKTQETARQQAETARANAEAARVNVEKARVSEESKRVSQEATRQTQEGTRQTNETARVTQYQQAQQLLDLLGQNPTVNLTNAVAELQKTAYPKSAYDFKIGHLVKTKIKLKDGDMVYIRLFYNAYSENRLREYVGYFYPYTSNVNPYHTKLFEIGNSPPIEISILYQTDGSVDLWMPVTGERFQTLFIEVFSSRRTGNIITEIIDTEEPTDVERKFVLPSEKSIPIATASADGLYPKEHFSKVEAIPASPKYTDTVTKINGKTGAIAKSDITALGIPAQDTVYTHPTTHPASIITQDSARRMVSDTQITAWNGKQSKIVVTTEAPTNATGYADGTIIMVIE